MNCSICQRPSDHNTCDQCSDKIFDGLNLCEDLGRVELGAFARAASETLPNGVSGREDEYPMSYYYRTHGGGTGLRCASQTPWELAYIASTYLTIPVVTDTMTQTPPKTKTNMSKLTSLHQTSTHLSYRCLIAAVGSGMLFGAVMALLS